MMYLGYNSVVKQLNMLVDELNQNHKRMTNPISNLKFELSVVSQFRREKCDDIVEATHV